MYEIHALKPQHFMRTLISHYYIRKLRPLPSGLGAEEQELLALFRQASELGRAVIMSAARGAEKKEAASAADQVA